MINFKKANSDSFLPIVIIVVITILLVVPLIFLFGGNSGGSGTGGTSEAVAANPSNPEDKRMIDILSVYSSIKTGKDYSSMRNQLTDLQSKIDMYNDSIQQDATVADGVKNQIQDRVVKIGLVVAKLNKLLSSAGASGSADATQATIEDHLKSLDTYIGNIRVLVGCAGGLPGVCAATKAREIVTLNESNHAITYSQVDRGPNKMDCSYFVSYVLQRAGVFKVGMTMNTGDFANSVGGVYFNFVLGNGTIGSATKSAVLDFANTGKFQLGDVILSVDGKGRRHVVMYIGPDVASDKNIAHSTTTDNMSGPQFGNLMGRLNRDDLTTLAVIRPK